MAVIKVINTPTWQKYPFSRLGMRQGVWVHVTKAIHDDGYTYRVAISRAVATVADVDQRHIDSHHVQLCRRQS